MSKSGPKISEYGANITEYPPNMSKYGLKISEYIQHMYKYDPNMAQV